MAKIAAELARALAGRESSGVRGRTAAHVLARGEGWRVEDVVCTSGPHDRPFEERHSGVSISIVAAGTFQYRSLAGHDLMTPGSLLLGSAGQSFECAHDHGAGDRCIAFHYDPGFFERLAGDAGAVGAGHGFRVSRLPPLRASAPLVARACAGLARARDACWEELAMELAARTVRLVADRRREPALPSAAALARVTRAVRAIERGAGARLTVADLAREARLSPYHFLRTFKQLTGLTPHQYVVRARLREAAARLVLQPTKVIDLALASGFGDVSNFNRAFRAEFGLSPRAYRRRAQRPPATS